MTSASVGRSGEDAAVRYLENQGLRLIARGFQTRWGEIDAIFRDRETWVFLEVKARAHPSDFPAIESVTPAKQRRLMNAALMYMKQHRLEGQAMRFDVFTLEGSRVEWIRDAFENSVDYTF